MTLQARIDELRRRGAARVDAPRLAQLEALARRMEAQPDAVRVLLRARAEAALDALARRLELAEGAAAPLQPAPPRGGRATASPLRAIGTQPAGELASAIRFRRVWSHARAQERVLQAASHKPANAGPLNSHALALQSLELMRALPGGYLRRFVGYAEALLWLEAVGAAPERAPQRSPGRGSRGRREDRSLNPSGEAVRPRDDACP